MAQAKAEPDPAVEAVSRDTAANVLRAFPTRSARAASRETESGSTPPVDDGRVRKLEALLALEETARKTGSLRELTYFMANETAKVLASRQVVVLRRQGRRCRVEMVSGVSSIDRNALAIRWLEGSLADVWQQAMTGSDAASIFALPEPKEGDRVRIPFREGLFLPFRDGKGRLFAGLVLLRAKAFSEGDTFVGTRIAGAYSHAWRVHKPRPLRTLTPRRRRVIGLLATLAVIAALFVPVPLTALAPVEVVARDPFVISAPMDGVIDEILIEPSSPVRAGTPLMRYVDTEIAAAEEVADRKLEVAFARLSTARQQAFNSPEGRKQIAVFEAEVSLAREELAYARAQKDKTVVRAPRDGVAVFDRKVDWQGRPVSVGQKVIELADPDRTEFQIDLAIADAELMQLGARARVFLDTDPLDPVPAVVTATSYGARPGLTEAPAFRLAARSDDARPLRIGTRGTAQVYGEKVSLGYYLFRKPLAAIRQWLGM